MAIKTPREQFWDMEVVSRKIVEHTLVHGLALYVTEVRRDAQGERLRLTYPIDFLRRED